MSVKTLKLKRVYAYAMYNGLRNIPPKDYTTTNEIKHTINDIMPALKVHLAEYLSRLEKVRDLQERAQESEEKMKELQPEFDKLNEDWKQYNKEHGMEMVAVDMPEDAYKTFKEQFNRDKWGRVWIVTIEEFAEVMASFDEADAV